MKCEMAKLLKERQNDKAIVHSAFVGCEELMITNYDGLRRKVLSLFCKC